MRKMNLTQGSEDWLLWRREGLGSSDASVVMGLGFVTIEELLEEKVSGKRREVNYAMRRGTKLEPIARRAFEDKTGLVMPPVCALHDTEDWLKVSLDGLSFMEDALLEVKAPKMDDHELALNRQVPDKYYAQIQHQFIVTKCDLAFYVSYSIAQKYGGYENPSLAIVTVKPDPAYMAELLEKETEFWGRVCEERAKRKWDHATKTTILP